ncbi:diguanylate cyclase [Caldimonas thermodepolymerans]|uniref:diguanylate cyclase n=1 Tax=Caldimonas thermodepolymerans TaxID=215580 RepID=A0A2S5T9Q1_9BURK|nr:GGDEF domain-containing protein [Caldimonas thermodepolymerans]PPE71721.1 GGDEF domain-containing protein [Caldimonas thermodepolymerans]QPC30747.1 diguanylate cyclase [Caldimonas thermodepolymerans]RDI02634.1 diguanylate cyclase [Caldimonas thermodepolymerans]UZG43488.1 diguanylate cyclase [Caldimonas thermodepolymerans]
MESKPGALGRATSPAPHGGPAATPAQLAKAALLRLAQDRLEPTPENYRRAYRAEAGDPPEADTPLPPAVRRLLERLGMQAGASVPGLAEALQQGRWDAAERLLDAADDSGTGPAPSWAALIGRLVKAIERGGRQWTSGRKKESLQRVLAGSRSDLARLQQRLTQLVASWETDTAPDAAAWGDALLAEAAAAASGPATVPGELAPAAADEALLPPAWQAVVGGLANAIEPALPADDPRCARLGARLEELRRPLATAADDELAEDWCGWAADARRLLEHRQHLTDQLRGLCEELTAGLADLSEDDSWVQGQCEAMRSKLQEGLSARTVRAVSHMLHSTRMQQVELKAQRNHARDLLKQAINAMLRDIGELGAQTGRFHDNMGRYASAIEQADSLESLAGMVKELVEETKSVQQQVGQTQQRLQAGQAEAEQLQQRVRQLEDELQRLSAEVSTDQLTEIANRRGLIQAFEAEHARAERSGRELAVGLLDIDNFKKLNDTLGHQTGDQALRFLAQHVKQALRPMDTVARYGGEEFVVLLPETSAEEAQVVLTRLQRTLSASFFMQEERKVFVTFSAGVTVYRPGERLEETLDRADEALYEAKRTGKNRTCIA